MSADRSAAEGPAFDKDYWEQHWDPAGEVAAEARGVAPVNPHLVAETAGLTPGTALDAGCGAGTEALWLAEQGWQVTAADISAAALASAAERAERSGIGAGSAGAIRWVEADVSTWESGDHQPVDHQPGWDLVTTHYAHPTEGQIAFYRRLARLVAPGGTLLIVGHLHEHADQDQPAHHHDGDHGPDHDERDHDERGGHHHPAEASVTAEAIAAEFAAAADQWRIETSRTATRTVQRPGREIELRDVIVRLRRVD